MRRIHASWLTLLVVLALSTAATRSARALEIAWLHDGMKIVEPLRFGPTSGDLLLGDMGLEVSLLAEGDVSGTLGPGMTGKVTKIVTRKTVWRSAGPCDEADPPVVESVNLPWLTELVLDGRAYWADISGDGKGEPGYSMECQTILGTIADMCVTKAGRALVANTERGSVAILIESGESDEVQCKGTPFAGKWLVTTQNEAPEMLAKDGSRITIGER